jgi:isoleucyl-tRNA synthetase
MEAVRRLSSLGRAARDQVGIRVRQPLGTLFAVIPGGVVVEPALLEILRDELNVRSIEFIEGAENLVTFHARPNFRTLGARFGKRTPAVADAIRNLTSSALAAYRRGDPLVVEVQGEAFAIGSDELEIVQAATGDFLVEAEGGYTVALDATLTPELLAEGLARELVSRVQRLRKEVGFDVSDRIRLGVAAGPTQRDAFHNHKAFIMRETLSVELELAGELNGAAYLEIRRIDVDGDEISIGIARTDPEDVR